MTKREIVDKIYNAIDYYNDRIESYYDKPFPSDFDEGICMAYITIRRKLLNIIGEKV